MRKTLRRLYPLLLLASCAGDDTGPGSASDVTANGDTSSDDGHTSDDVHISDDTGTSDTSDDTSGPDTASDGSTGPDGEAGACAAAIPSFSPLSASELIQWDFGEGEKASQADAPVGFDYYLPDQGIITIYAMADGSTITAALDGLDTTTVAAGTYTCADGLGVSLSNIGAANRFGADAGADCAITFDDDIESGGRLEGTFWAYMPTDGFHPGGCVHGRFAVTDAE